MEPCLRIYRQLSEEVSGKDAFSEEYAACRGSTATAPEPRPDRLSESSCRGSTAVAVEPRPERPSESSARFWRWRADFHFRHFDYCFPPDFYARVGIAGVPADTKNMCRTRIVDDQWILIWNEEFEFPIHVPELALLRIDVKDYDPSGEDEVAGQTSLPLSELS
uniref:Phosphoinositide phospholipase C 2-like n=1 Tax=Nicotiana tabacum TaxID=4097 RepID=A0A1S3ZW02_TOBAC|nr:PREDICTED: phosphoinositide phospholipase C 2-like [Nicotiana tabacum]